MKIEIFSKALDEIGDKYITEAVSYKKAKKHKAIKWLAIAAGMCLMIGVGIDTINRYEFFYAGCGANIGTIVDGTYYYHVKSNGFYSYSTEEGNRKLISTYWYDTCSANEYGVYYHRGRSLYVQEHETGKRRKLFSASCADSSHIRFTLQADGSVIVTVYNKYDEYVYELLLDGITGEMLQTVMEKTSYDMGDLYYSRSHFLVEDREVVLVRATEGYDLQENGVSILPEGIEVSRYSVEYIGDNLWFYVEDDAELLGGEQSMFIVRPDGQDALVKLPFYNFYSGNNDYLFWADYDTNDMWCFEVVTGESWTLEADNDMTFYSLVSDGEYVYSCVPWDDYQAKWKIVYNEDGRPVKMQLVDNDIQE